MSAFSAKRALSAVAAVAVTAIALSGCAAPAPTYAKGDGVLKLGGVLPLTGALAFLSPPEIAGIDLAIKDINDAGGVLGQPVTFALEDSSDGDHAEVAPASAKKLLASGVDAIIGAAASGVTRNIIDTITKAKTVQISMSNTAPDLSEWKDGGYYFRTAPSDLLQGGVVGNQIVKDGNENVGIIFQDTAYGQGLEKKAAEVITGAGATVVAAEAFPEGESNFDTIVDKVIAAGADSVLLISYDEVKKIVPSLQKKKFDGSKIYLVDGNLANFSDQAWAGYLTGAQGTLPGGETDATFKQRAADLYKANYGKDLTEFAYLSESYDAVILLALAAEQAKNDSGEAIMNNMTSVSTGGEKVKSFAEGLAALKAGKDIDYDGFSGPIEFDKNGDPTGASIGIWKYVDGSGVSTLQEVVAGNSVK
jgi:branched-chain amino acid transport system substrate-binding protein